MDIPFDGSVQDLVNMAASSDARARIVDNKTGAKISINISDVDEDNPDAGPPEYEPFYIEHGDNFYDAYNKTEARMILSNIRRGLAHPDESAPRPKSKSKKSSRKSPSPMSLRGIR